MRCLVVGEHRCRLPEKRSITLQRSSIIVTYDCNVGKLIIVFPQNLLSDWHFNELVNLQTNR